MKIERFNSYQQLSEAAAEFVIGRLQADRSTMLCAATGGSPTGMYRSLAVRGPEIDTKKLRVLKLDEWYGLPMDHPGTCETYLNKHLIGPMQIEASNYISFNSEAPDAEDECRRIEEQIQRQGPIDICILGIGLNGHLALNEPAESLQYGVHSAVLAESSKQHPMIAGSGVDITHGLTLGMGDIMASKTIVLLVNGPSKKTIFNRLLEKQISTRLPASLLWLHPDAHCFYSEQ